MPLPASCQCCLTNVHIRLDTPSNDKLLKDEKEQQTQQEGIYPTDGLVECFPGCAACCHYFHHQYCTATCDAHRDEEESMNESIAHDMNSSPLHTKTHHHDVLRYRPAYRSPPAVPAADGLSLDKVNTDASDNSNNSNNKQQQSVSVIRSLSFIDRFLSLWIILVMVIGVVVGYYSSSAQTALNSGQITTVSLPVAFGLWFMMYPVLVKVKYEAFGNIFSKRDTFRQLAFSILANWFIGPFIMLAVAWITLPDLSHYRNGVILVGLARCIAMVLIWNQLAQGDPEYCAILVAINSVLQIILYAPLAIFFLVVISHQYTGGSDGSFQLSYWDVCQSVFLFLGVPLAAAILTRFILLATAGKEWFTNHFVPLISPLSLIALLWTVFVIFCLQGHNIIDNIGDVCRVAVPMVVYFAIMFSLSLVICRWLEFGYEKSVTQAFTASSNNFELAIAVAAATFGVDSPEALAATIGPLVEVPVLLSLVYVALWLQSKLSWPLSPILKNTTTKDQSSSSSSPSSSSGTKSLQVVELARCK